MLDELFRKVSLAPNAAKTAPSQSVSIALGHAVEAFPTPEAVATLRDVLRAIRHAGVKKKLQRDLRGAERGLANRPEIALRLPLGQAISKPQLTTITRCLEAGLALRMELPYEDWRALGRATRDEAPYGLAVVAHPWVWRRASCVARAGPWRRGVRGHVRRERHGRFGLSSEALAPG